MDNKEYDWKLILMISIPVSIGVVLIFWKVDSDFLKGLFLIMGSLLSGWLTYRKSKKKSNIFTSAAIILLVAVIITLLKRLGQFVF